MISRRPLLLFSLLFAGSLGAAPLPDSWSGEDLPRGGRPWYSVEVAQFPSELLAQGVADSLIRAGWGPVVVETTPGAGARVLLGEVTAIPDAHFMAKEVAAQKLADGKIVSVQPGLHAPEARRFQGALVPPFSAQADVTDAEIERVVQGMKSDEKLATAAEFVMAALNDPAKGPQAGGNAVVLIDDLWAKELQGEVVLALALRVARGEWPASAAQRDRCRERAVELLHAKGDWRGAWAGAQQLAGSSDDPEIRARARLRQAALVADLYRVGATPQPDLAALREFLRDALVLLPDALEADARRMESVYVQTFAWEGCWERVEVLAEDFLAQHGEGSADSLVVRSLLAQSMARFDRLPDAKQGLKGVAEAPLARAEFFRFGMERRDPRYMAREALARLEELEARRDPPVIPKEVLTTPTLTVAQPVAEAEDAAPAPPVTPP